MWTEDDSGRTLKTSSPEITRSPEQPVVTMSKTTVENDDVTSSVSRIAGASLAQQNRQREPPATRLGVSQIYKRVMIKGSCRLLIFTLCWGPYLMATFLYLMCPDHCGVTDLHLAGLSLLLSVDATANFFVFLANDTGFLHRVSKMLRCRSSNEGNMAGGLF